MINGVDVSHWQGRIDWPAVASSGISFAFVKVTEGTTFVDPMGGDNIAGALGAGICAGGYHFLRPSDPEGQARHFLEHLPREVDLPSVLDLEDEDIGPDAGARALAWLRAVEEATGRTPILYTGPWYATVRRFDRLPELARFPLFVAHYGVAAPHVPGPWAEWSIWQTTGKGRCPGIVGDVDLDVALRMPG